MSSGNFKTIRISPEMISVKQEDILALLPQIEQDPIDLLVTALALETIAAEYRVKAATYKAGSFLHSPNLPDSTETGASGDT